MGDTQGFKLVLLGLAYLFEYPPQHGEIISEMIL